MEGGFGLTAAVIGIAALGIIALGAIILSSPSGDMNDTEPTSDTLPMNDGAEPMMEEPIDEGGMSADAEMEGNIEMMGVEMDTEMDMESESTSMNDAGVWTDYDPALLANAEDGRVLLFFHASWCPSCRALERSINENLSEIPSDVTIMKVDFDTETELRQKYGIVRQHTLVHVDANGNEIETLTGLTNTLDQVINQI